MPPRIIADSDDSGDDGDGDAGNSSPLSPIPSAASDPGLESTDTVSFQQLHAGQHAAAQEISRDDPYGQINGHDPYIRTGGIKDPYDIPSSPMQKPDVDEHQESASVAERSTGGAAVATAKKNRPTVDADVADPGTSTQDRKRRKIGKTSFSTENHEDLDLVAFPSSHIDELEGGLPEPSGSLPPTMPINSSHSLMVTMKTGAQSSSYIRQNYVPPSTAGLSEDQGLSKPTQARLVYASSGSMTNVNTPRTEKYASQDVEMAPIPENSPSPLHSQPGQQVTSSFDEITGLDQVQRSAAKGSKRKSNVGTDGARSNNQTHDELDENYDEAIFPIPDNHEDDDEEFTEKLSKPKKQRGRPKKTAAPEATKGASHVTTEGGSTPAVPPKKKRGRPKKTQQTTEAEKCPSTVDKSELNQALADTVEDKCYDNQDQVQDNSAATIAGEEDAESDPEAAPKARGNAGAINAASVAIAEKPSAEEPTTPQITDHVGGSSSSVKNSAKENQTKGPNNKGLGALLSKPAYRVGLSKRSKIAPLLKSVPK